MPDANHDDATLIAEDRGDTPVPGAKFAGRYVIERMLGRGAMGAVYAAQDEDVGERVALKILTCGDAPEVVERFRREVRLARRVTHRNAARTYDLGEHAGQHYLTMELVEGESLQDRMARGPLSHDDIVDIGVQLCQGLGAAHAVGVVHRDLKPANVLIESTGRVVITDFGVARAVQGDAEVTTDRMAVVGTPAYMAPEQLTGDEIGPHTDVFALGVMLYELLTGQRPFGGETAMAIATARLTQTPADPRTLAPIDDAVATMLQACLEREPPRRPSSVDAVAQALAQGSTMPGLGTDATLAVPGATPLPSSPPTPADRSLAVLPFRYRGPEEEAYLGDALWEELVDVLSITRGLKVSGTGATAQLEGIRDPKQVGERLGVDAIVDGTLHRAPGRVRIVARLVDVSGFQLWTDRFDGNLEDVFDLQDRVARRVAEGLRLELQQQVGTERVPEDVAQLYLQARALTRRVDLLGERLTEGWELLHRALDKAPTFAPALAQAAAVAVLRWFVPVPDPERDWQAESKRAVEAALSGAPHLAETHTAAARYAVARGDIGGAVKHLQHALDIAPTSADTIGYLGFLQCEAGRSEEGVRNILLGYELDPNVATHLVSVARQYALEQRWDDYEAMLLRLRSIPEQPRFTVDLTEMRVAGWRNDMERVRRVRPSLAGRKTNTAETMPELLRDVVLGNREPDEAMVEVDRLLQAGASPRFACITRQLATEALAILGKRERAFEQLDKALGLGVLIDADWIERCPALDTLRDEPRFQEVRRAVRSAADALWQT